MLVLMLTIIQIVYFVLIDWERAFDTPFKEVESAFKDRVEDTMEQVIIENNQRKLKMITYREKKDGGI